MATSYIRFYKTKLTPERNALMDDLEDYLATTSRTALPDFQYIRHGLDIEIKLNTSQSEVNKDYSYNYVSIKNTDDDRRFYYFITAREQIAQNTVKYYLSMDTVNTFADKLASTYWTDKTKLMRQHKDRFKTSHSGSAYARNIDRSDEGIANAATKINSTRTLKEKTTYDTSDSAKWYLVYKSNNELQNTNSNVPVDLYLVPNHSVIIASTGNRTWYRNEVPMKYMMFDPDENPSNITITYKGRTADTGKTYTGSDVANVLIEKDGSYLRLYYNGSQVAQSSDSTASITVNHCHAVRVGSIDNIYKASILEVAPTSGSGVYAKKLVDFDLTDSRLIKIIECPYCPIQISRSSAGIFTPLYPNSVEILVNEGLIKISSRNLSDSAFYNVLDLTLIPDMTKTLNPHKTDLKIVDNESKLYNSAFNSLKFNYDANSMEFKRESAEANSITVGYYHGCEITSNLLFKFYNTNYIKTDLYENCLLSNRNLEKPIYNSAYIDYMRSSYNYDKQARTQQAKASMISLAIGTVGSVGSTAVGIATGSATAASTAISMGTSTLSSISGAINNYVSASINIRAKKAELANQAVSFTGADDLSLFNEMTNNKLTLTNYVCEDRLKDLLYELFNRTGYNCETNAIPDFESRRAFNFVQCDPVLRNEADSGWADYIADIKARFNTGITKYHKFRYQDDEYDEEAEEWIQYYTWDFDQTYENWETWLCER